MTAFVTQGLLDANHELSWVSRSGESAWNLEEETMAEAKALMLS